MGSGKQGETPSLRQRAKAEMLEYLFISLYLWVCFSAIILYENSILAQDNSSLLSMSTALIKALILGKFILIGKALKPGTRKTPSRLSAKIAWKALSMLVLLILFTYVEELVVGLVHDRTVSEVVGELTSRSLLEKIAPAIMMLLVLIPMIAFEEVDRELGEGTLRGMLFGKTDSG